MCKKFMYFCFTSSLAYFQFFRFFFILAILCIMGICLIIVHCTSLSQAVNSRSGHLSYFWPDQDWCCLNEKMQERTRKRRGNWKVEERVGEPRKKWMRNLWGQCFFPQTPGCCFACNSRPRGPPVIRIFLQVYGHLPSQWHPQPLKSNKDISDLSPLLFFGKVTAPKGDKEPLLSLDLSSHNFLLD